MHEAEMKYIKEAFDTNWIAPLGPNVNEFEKELAAYVGAGHCAALSAGSAALHLAIKIMGIERSDTVISSAFTFAATCNPAAAMGANLVFVDSEPDTWNLSPAALERALEKHPEAKAVIIVHLYGVPAKMDEIIEICKKHQVSLIEDAAESLGATYKGRQTGTFGDIGVYSFNGNKIITTSGGGALVSENESWIQKARFLSTQAREDKPYYEHVEIGYNYRMSNIVAGIGRGQLLHLDEHIALKKKIYMTYKEALRELPVKMNPYDADNSEPNFWLSAVTIDEGVPTSPKDIIEALAKENIESRPLWNPMQRQPVYSGCDFVTEEGREDNPLSSEVFERGLCLPSDIKNTDEDMEKIIGIIRGCF